MPDQELHPVCITEPWPRQRSRYLIVCVLCSLVLALAAGWVDTTRLTALQSFYLRSYLLSSVASSTDSGTVEYFPLHHSLTTLNARAALSF